MIPPFPSDLLTSNPHFSRLHDILKTRLLNQDCSTRALTESHRATAKALRVRQLEARRGEMLVLFMDDLIGLSNRDDSHGVSLDRDMVDKVDVVVSWLGQSTSMVETSLTPEQVSGVVDELVQSEIEKFVEMLPTISRLLPGYVDNEYRKVTESVRRLALVRPSGETGTGTRRGHGGNEQEDAGVELKAIIRSLDHDVGYIDASIDVGSDSRSRATTGRMSLCDKTLSTASHTHAILNRYRALLVDLVRHLERYTFGTQSRYTRARAEYLAHVARTMELKARVMRLETERRVYAEPELLKEYFETLKRQEKGLGERWDVLRSAVEEFGWVEEGKDGGGEQQKRKQGHGGRAQEEPGGDGAGMGIRDEEGRQIMIELGRRYGATLKEIEEVKKDIRKIEDEKSGKKK